MGQLFVKLVVMPDAAGNPVLGINLKVARIPLSSALRSGWHIVPMKHGNYIDIQDAIRWYRAAHDEAAVEGLISAAQRGRALLAKGS